MHTRKKTNRILEGVTRRYRVAMVVSVVTEEGDTNAKILNSIRDDLKNGLGLSVVEKVEDVEYIPEEV